MASSSESNRDRRERLRQLALETIDINKVGWAGGCLVPLWALGSLWGCAGTGPRAPTQLSA